MTKNKFDFITELLTTKQLKHEQKERLFILISKEIQQIDKTDKQLLKRIEEIEKIIIEKNIKNEKENKGEKIDSKKKKIKHNPQQNVEILKKFKYNNSSGFKELVHKANDSENFSIIEFNDILTKAEDSFKKMKDIPIDMYKNIQELILLMKNEGKECIIKTNQHPYLNFECDKIDEEKIKTNYYNISKNVHSPFITYIIQNFKCNYRFDKERTEASILRELIENIFNQEKRLYEDNDHNIIYSYKLNRKFPDKTSIIIPLEFITENFDDEAIFFTWVPNLKKAFIKIADDILKHGNIYGTRAFKSNNKIVSVSIDRFYDEMLGVTKIPLTIFDEKSFCNKNPEQMFPKMEDMCDDYFVGLCDWSIEFDTFNNESYRLEMLPNKLITKLSSKVGGFKHILTFYD